MHIDCTGVQLYLNRTVIEIQEGNRRLFAHANRRRPDMHLSSGSLVCPQTIPPRHWPVQTSPAPVGFASRLE